jgi:hypothetical protein
MAKQKGKFLRGVVGPVSFKVVRDEQIVTSRKAPGTTNQSEGTKASNKIFGKLSSLGASIREIYAVNQGSYFDSSVNSRLTGTLRNILSACQDKQTKVIKFKTKSFTNLVGFNFNDKARMDDFLSFKPRVSIKAGVLTVAFDSLTIAKQLKFPMKSFRCVVTIGVSKFNLTEGLLSRYAENQGFEVLGNVETVPAQTFSFNVPDGCLCLTRLSLEFFVVTKAGWKAVTEAKANPSSICGAIYTSGKFLMADPLDWCSNEKLRMF